MRRNLLLSCLLFGMLLSCKKEDNNVVNPIATTIDINKNFKSVVVEVTNLDCSTIFSADSSKAHGGVWDWKGVVKPLAYSVDRLLSARSPKITQTDLKYDYYCSFGLCSGGSFTDIFLLKLNSSKTEFDSLKVSIKNFASEFGPINESSETDEFELIACNLKPSIVNDTMMRFDFTDSRLLNSITRFCKLNTSYWNLEVSNSKGSYYFSYNPPVIVKPNCSFSITFKY